MNIWNGLKKLVTEGSISNESSTFLGTSSSVTQEWTSDGSSDSNAWGNSSGSVVNGSNSIRTVVTETNVSGSGDGSMEQLSGSTFIHVVLDRYPAITQPVAIKVSVTVTEGVVNVSFLTPDRAIVSGFATADTVADIAGISEIQFNTLRIKLEAVSAIVRGIHYQLAFEPT